MTDKFREHFITFFNYPFIRDTLKTKWTPRNEGTSPGDSWRRKECPLETLGDEKNAPWSRNRLLETKVDYIFYASK
ncbi:hypothetical protein RhiirB3_452841 [Rhizophagus irregularis]|nr:hypothetical protein RhiirB3_452841 [Rhizophagus irregularis]